MNELMAKFRGKDLPSKKKEYVVYLDTEWDDLAREKDLIDKTLKIIIVEVEHNKPGLEWLERRGAPLNPTQRETDLTPSDYVQGEVCQGESASHECCNYAEVHGQSCSYPKKCPSKPFRN